VAKNVPAHIKIAYVGGGSRLWAPKLLADLALSPLLTGEIALYDIDHEAARRNVQLGRRIFALRDAASKFEVSAVEEITAALDGADFVVLSIEPGPTRLRYADLEIPRSHGILQTVGDTTGPGGILRGLRSVPICEELAHQVAASCPGAWVINYTNPLALCVAALAAAEPGLKVFGCCHEVFGTQERLASLVAQWFAVPVPPRSEIALEIAGVNHFTFALGASWKGNDLLGRLRAMAADPATFSDHSGEAARRKREERWFEHDMLIALDFLRNFGALGAAGDRHLAEFVPWYLPSEDLLHRWGIILTPYEWRMRRMSEYPVFDPGAPLQPSGEEGVLQIQALLGLGALRSNVNVPNRGQAPGLPRGSVVETYAVLDQDSLEPIPSPRLPDALEGHVERACAIQQLTLSAGLRRDPETAFQALLSDPLVRIPTDGARVMFSEMLRYVQEFLPGWSKEVAR
jgi:galacturan 1,4-alpha-galacturonidase